MHYKSHSIALLVFFFSRYFDTAKVQDAISLAALEKNPNEWCYHFKNLMSIIKYHKNLLVFINVLHSNHDAAIRALPDDKAFAIQLVSMFRCPRLHTKGMNCHYSLV